MKNITLTVNKAYVYDEVAKTTSYTGLKMMAVDNDAYNRIFTTDEDRLLLERFWVETCNTTTSQFKPFIKSLNSQPISHGIDLSRNYTVELELSNSFDENLSEAMETSLFSFFVSSIVSKWFGFANKPEMESYTTEAVAIMNDLMQKIYYKKKPTRVIPK